MGCSSREEQNGYIYSILILTCSGSVDSQNSVSTYQMPTIEQDSARCQELKDKCDTLTPSDLRIWNNGSQEG